MNQLFTFVADPLIHKLPAGATLIATSVVAPFTVPFKLALLLAVGLAMPFVLYQAWAFVAPGLYKHEKKLAVPLLVSSVLLFYLGAAFAYYAVFPVMLSFFVATTPHGVQMMTDMGSYLDFVMILLLAFGLAFEVPVATVLLVWTGFVRLATLKKNRGFVLLGIFIFAAFVTPPDAVSQSAMAVPMYLLYEIGIIMAGLLLKDKIAARAKEDAEQAEREAGALGSLIERHLFRAPAWPRHAVLHGDVGAIHLLRHARRAGAVPGRPPSPPAASASTTKPPQPSMACTRQELIWWRSPAAGLPIG